MMTWCSPAQFPCALAFCSLERLPLAPLTRLRLETLETCAAVPSSHPVEMYSDQISTGRKRSIQERLDGDLPAGGGRARNPVSKRQRQIDEKWKHDLYREDDEPASKSIDPKDLRLKLQRRSSQTGFTSTRSSGVRDLREKLSGTMHPQPSNADPPKPKSKPVSEVVTISRRETADEMPARQSKRASKQTSSKKTSQPKTGSPLDSFLSSLGLEKYSITFQAEEVDMAALRHMTDSDLKALGIPMGPRKKIILALESRA